MRIKQAERKVNYFDPKPDLGNANVGNIDKLLMRVYPYEGPVFCAISPVSGGHACVSGHLTGKYGEPAMLPIQLPLRGVYYERIFGKCKKYNTAGT